MLLRRWVCCVWWALRSNPSAWPWTCCGTHPASAAKSCSARPTRCWCHDLTTQRQSAAINKCDMQGVRCGNGRAEWGGRWGGRSGHGARARVVQ
ncbi:hypothetical protein V8C86DRAFT_246855 [Haematococcus lacustris]